MVLGTLLLRDVDEFFLQLCGFFVCLSEFVNFSGEFFPPVVENVLSDFFFIERDYFLDGADLFFQVLAQGRAVR